MIFEIEGYMDEELAKNSGRHYCEHPGINKLYGGAINYTYMDENGALWSGNGEYESQVNYCPFCGLRGTEIIPIED